MVVDASQANEMLRNVSITMPRGGWAQASWVRQRAARFRFVTRGGHLSLYPCRLGS